MEAQDYAGGWKLGEKKKLREHEPKAKAEWEVVLGKLGAGWTVEYAWDVIRAECIKVSKDNAEKYLQDIGNIFLLDLPEKLAKEFSELDAETVEALNDAVGANKVIRITAEDSNSFKFAYYNIGEIKNGLIITFKASELLGKDKSEYPWNGKTVTAFILQNV